MNGQVRKGCGRIAVAALFATASMVPTGQAASTDDLLLSDDVVPYEQLGEDFIERPRLVGESLPHGFIVEKDEEPSNPAGDVVSGDDRPPLLGDPFLSPGPVQSGFEIPTGAIWQPQLTLFGRFRSAVQTFDNGVTDVTEWANRLDIFANMAFTPTERLVLGFRPLDRKGEFSGYRFRGNRGKGWESHFNGNVRALFFEGNVAEIFPGWAKDDGVNLDYNVAVGRMPLEFQDGIMINDTMDAVGITRASLFWFGASAFRIAGVIGFSEIDRADNRADDDARLYGIFMTADYAKSSFDVDLAYVDGSDRTGGDGLYLGIGQTRRYGHWNSTLRANFSWALEDETAAVSSGTLLFGQVSRTMPFNSDLFYVNGFWAIDEYASAARDPAVGGPLGQTGLLFDAVGLGEYGSALGNGSIQAVGGALGYQHYLDEGNRRQIVGEIGGRVKTGDVGRSAGAIGGRYQHAFGQHWFLIVDGFAAWYEGGDFGYGGRCEMQAKF